MKSTKERLVTALTLAGASQQMLDNAAKGVYDDFESPLATPQSQLRADALAEGLMDIADAVEKGEFDGSKAEADAWAASSEGKAAIHEVLPPKPRFTGSRVRLEDDSFVDRIVIETIPRFKTSGLSGDEWRHHAQITAYRKGRVVAERGVGNLDYAVRLLATNDWWSGGVIHNASLAEDLCDQPGCSEPWTVLYRMKVRGCGRCGSRARYAGEESHPYLRAFCERHKRRGDSNLDDMDDLYEAIEPHSI